MNIKSIATLSGIFWVASLFLALGTIAPAMIERMASVTMALCSLFPLILYGEPIAQRATGAGRIALAILGLWVVAGLSIFWSVAPAISLVYFGSFSVLPATLLALLLADDAMRKSFLRAAIIGTAAIILGLAIWDLVQAVFFPGMLNNGKVVHPFANPNGFAGLLGLSFFAAFGFYLRAGDRKPHILMWLYLFLILSAFFSLASRAATGTMAIGLILLMIFYGRDILLPRWKSLSLLILAVAAMTTLIAHLPARNNIIYQVATVTNENAPSINSRLDLWASTIALIKQHPILGSGYGTFQLMYPSVRSPDEIVSAGANAHNDPLQLWSELGIFGIGLFYAIGLLVLIRFVSYWKHRTPDTARDIFLLSLFQGCAAFIGHAHVDFLFYALPMTMVFALVLSVLLDETKPATARPDLTFMARWPTGLDHSVILLPILACLAALIPVMLGEYHSNRAARLFEEDRITEFGSAVNNAHTIGWGLNDKPYLLAVNIPMGLLQSDALPKAQQEPLFHQIDGLLNQALQHNSRLATAWLQRGLMLQRLDPSIPPKNYPTAEDSFTQALSLNPQLLPARIRLAEILQRRNDQKGALDVLMAGMTWPYAGRETETYYTRAQILVKDLHRDDLLPVIEKSKTIYTDNVKFWRAHP